jgi:hypothetical protein
MNFRVSGKLLRMGFPPLDLASTGTGLYSGSPPSCFQASYFKYIVGKGKEGIAFLIALAT